MVNTFDHFLVRSEKVLIRIEILACPNKVTVRSNLIEHIYISCTSVGTERTGDDATLDTHSTRLAYRLPV